MNHIFLIPVILILKFLGIRDVCHMFKLVRNTLGDLTIICDNKNKPIR